MKKIKKETNLLMEKCKVCGQEITGYTEPQVNSRMRMHMMMHEKKKNEK